MKITEVIVHKAAEWRTFLFVEVRTDSGITGWGESGLTTRELAVEGAVHHLAPLVLGESPFDTDILWQRMARTGFYPAGNALSAAISAIDIALWDIKAQALGVPLYQLIGGRSRDKVMVYNHLDSSDIDSVVEAGKRAKDEGWKCVRFEPAYGPDGLFDANSRIDEAFDIWAALREAVGPDLHLAYDAHTRFTIAEAMRLCRGVEPYRPFFIEDPLRSDQPHQYSQLRNHVHVPLAAGEQFPNKWHFKPLLEQNLIDFARVDLCICGGITEGLKIAAMAEAAGIDIAVHNPVGPISTAASLHFNLAISNMGVMELPRRPGETMAEAIVSDIVWEDGYLLPPKQAGISARIEPEALAQFPFRKDELPHCHRPDGSFTNW